MRDCEEIYRDIEKVNKRKRDLIQQYLYAQSSVCVPPELKLTNTKTIFYELRKCNDSITNLETELVSFLHFSV